jgi:uncharacterized cupin superfamily protein
MASGGADGPRATVVAPGGGWSRAPLVPGSTVRLLVDGSVQGADLYGGINVLEPGARVPLHWHSVGEFMYVLAGTGVSLGLDGHETPVEPHSLIYGPAGPDGAHGFFNTGTEPLTILFVYPSPGGEDPSFHPVLPSRW